MVKIMPGLKDKSGAKWRGGYEKLLGYDQKIWRKRIVALSRFISNEDKTVMDLGAGHMHLRKLLPRGTIYLPVDYKKNAEDTIVCDFNKYEFPDRKTDVMVAAGILEYMDNPRWFLEQMTVNCNKIILSYKGREKFPNSILLTKEIIDFLNEKDFIMAGMDNSLSKYWTLIACFEKATPQKIGAHLKCTGCGACVNCCPADALRLDYDDFGFLKPVWNESRCIGCNECIYVCPAIHRDKNTNFESPVLYAAWAEDEIRFNSSSGGVFSVLASETIKQNGVVYGVVWGDEFICHHKGIGKKSELEFLRYSKYSQSDPGLTYREVKRHLEEDRKVLYVGCPCQIAGLKKYLGRLQNHKLLLTVDFICFCVPSNVLFQRYLDETFGIENVFDVTFRFKHLGWSPVGYRIDLKDGSAIYPDSSLDPYQKAFHGVLARNDVCENCQYAGFPRQGDLTLGDFWGIGKFDKTWDDGNGTSALMINSPQGKIIVDLLQHKNAFKRIEKVPVEWLRHGGNRIGTDGRRGHKGRRRFLQLLNDKPIEDSVNIVLNGQFDVGLAVVFNRNIGNNLTNYALYHTIKDMGYQVLLIDAPKSTEVKKGYLDDILDLFLVQWVEESEIFSKEYKSEYKELNNRCKQFVLGSDQLWRSMFVEASDFYTCLDFVSGYKYKIAYGTSFGVNNYEGNNYSLSKMKFLLERFQGVGVRESWGPVFLKEQFNIKGKTVLDPVFLCDCHYYQELAFIGSMRLPQVPYVASYTLDMGKDIAESLKFTAEKISNGIYHLILDSIKHYDGQAGFGLAGLKEPSIEEWLASIYNCSFFITDSFHGLCFALIFHKPFLVVFNKNNWRGYERIIDILSRLNLGDRIVESFDMDQIVKIIESDVDYDKVDNALRKEIECSRNWLANRLATGMEWEGEADGLDIAKYLYDELSKDMERKIIAEARRTRSMIFLDKIRNNEMNWVQGWRDEEMQVVAWAAGVCFQRNIKLVKEVYDLQYVCDKDPGKWGQEYWGVKCISPKELIQMGDVMVVIMIDSPGVSFKIVEELLQMGINKFDHIENWLAAIKGDMY